MPKSERVGNKWQRGFAVVALLLGVTFTVMIFAHPFGLPWMWALLLVVYLPILMVITFTAKAITLVIVRLRKK
jgi:hypothetical protein